MSTDQQELVTALSPILDHMPDWRLETPHDHNAQLVGPEGVRINCHVETYGTKKGRLTLSASVPPAAEYSKGDYHGLDRPSITVDPAREPAALAKDITRRLTGFAIEYWREVSERVARRQQRETTRQATAEELAMLMGGTARQVREDWEAELPEEFRQWSSYCYGDMKPSSDSAYVIVEIRNLPLDRARELAALIKTWTD